MLKGRRVGTLTAGIMLIVFGLAFMARLFSRMAPCSRRMSIIAGLAERAAVSSAAPDVRQ